MARPIVGHPLSLYPGTAGRSFEKVCKIPETIDQWLAGGTGDERATAIEPAFRLSALAPRLQLASVIFAIGDLNTRFRPNAICSFIQNLSGVSLLGRR